MKQSITGEGAAQSKRLVDKLKSTQFNTTRRILFSWIRPTILGCSRDYLDIQNDDLVCYVMPYRSTTDLLVLDHAVKKMAYRGQLKR